MDRDSRRLVISTDPTLLDVDLVHRAMLATQDAHGVCARFGFEPLAEPDLYMSRGYEPR